MTMAGDTQAGERIDEVVAMIESATDFFDRGLISTTEVVGRITDLVVTFIAGTPGGPDDIQLVWDYAQLAVEDIVNRPDVRDPLLVEWFEEAVQLNLRFPVLRARMDDLLSEITSAIRARDPHGAVDLVELCRTGWRTHRALLNVPGAVERVLDTAHRYDLPAALLAAIDPAEDRAQIANARSSRSQCLHALDLLAHLGAHPHPRSSGDEARDALIMLTSRFELAGEAAVRLPLHLVTDSQRSRLVDIVEARTDLFGDDPIEAYTSLDVMRDDRIIRHATWQAHDAAKL